MASKRKPRKSSPKKRAPANTRKAAPPAARKRVDTDAAVKWYRERRPHYQSLCEKVAGIVEEVLKAEGVELHSVTSRVKQLDSFEKKAARYGEPTVEIHDLAGVRVIAYVESEARRVADIVRGLLEVDEAHSEDKSLELGVDKVGYRAVHYVGTLPASRCKLPEFKRFEGMKFEVQVRTILQHAWAEIEHDRNYKFTGVLPGEIERRFKLLAGALEMADREFDRIAAEIGQYRGEVVERTSAGELNIPVNTISLRQYLVGRFPATAEKGKPRRARILDDDAAATLVGELTAYGIATVAELDRMVPEGFDESPYITEGHIGLLSIVRVILTIADPDRFFGRIWKARPIRAQPSAWEILAAFGVDVDSLAEKYGLELRED